MDIIIFTIILSPPAGQIVESVLENEIEIEMGETILDVNDDEVESPILEV